jgi:hypothetical protein
MGVVDEVLPIESRVAHRGDATPSDRSDPVVIRTGHADRRNGGRVIGAPPLLEPAPVVAPGVPAALSLPPQGR